MLRYKATMARKTTLRILKAILWTMLLLDAIIVPAKHIMTPIFYPLMALGMCSIVGMCVFLYLRFGRKELIEGRCRRSAMIGASGAMLTAFAYFMGNVLDKQDDFCDRDSWWQWHAVFHVLTVIGFLMILYEFLLQVRRRDTQSQEPVRTEMDTI